VKPSAAVAPDPAAVAWRGARAAYVPRRPPWKWLAGGVLGVLLAFVAVGLAAGFSYRDLRLAGYPITGLPSARERREVARLDQSILAQTPSGIHIVVDTLGNRLYLKKGPKVLREAVCSTGTGGVLTDPATGRRWVFDTPRGSHRVIDKKRDPVWNKPDWAFIEEGEPVPKDPAARRDDFSLGDYALYLGDGYLIHGTLYQRLLGRGVTHGCVRLGDEDLEAVFKAAPVGTRVYIY
jgi:L,D-transpeptidase YbiS